jgi:TrmH family RNA methyltransferase
MRLTRAEIEEYRALRSKEGRQEKSQFLLEGWRALAAAIAADAPIVGVAILSDQSDRPELKELEKRRISIGTVGERDLARISATEHSQGIVARVRMARHEFDSLLELGNRILLTLDAVGDPGNVGTMIRTADWFGAGGVLLGQGSVDPFNEKVVRATAGSLFHLPIIGDLDLVKTLTKCRSAGFQLAVADANGSLILSEWRPSRRCVIVVGSEGHGISGSVQSLADVSVSIPRGGRAESLNVAVAAGLLLEKATNRLWS